ncbi:tRNA pseudouridine(38-40) synthase TruA [Bacteriovoracaceae bacterium]|nr:tRNA pseudouridine(38-40) synthase TruA [Bacteriovoracaceae bacterium]
MSSSELFYFRGVVAYDGTGFQGWQSQKNGQGIQDQILAALKQVSDSEFNRIVGSGRTDSGVHAHQQVFTLRMTRNIPPESLLKAINTKLSQAIRVIELAYCSKDFHPLKNVIKKEYNYFFSTSKTLDPCLSNYVLSYPFPVDLPSIIKAANIFEGEHDFALFSNTGSEVKDTIRSIQVSQIHQIEGRFLPFLPISNEIYQYQVIGKGFLKQMVRNMAGALLMVGRGKLSEDDLTRSVTENVPLPYKYCAPARGLHQMDVKYLD